MAHVEHFKKPDIKRVVNEYERDANYKCRDGRIDPKRTPDNYVMDSTVTDYNARFEKRFNEIKHSTRKDLNVISDWVITCPQELKDNKQNRERFFELSYEFVKDRYGEKNVMQGYVHMDETTPHMHVSIIPEVDGSVSAKKLFTRAELRSFHRDLDKIMEHEFDMPHLILNGRTKGNYTVQECKEREKQERELRDRQMKLDDDECVVRADIWLSDERKKALDARESDLEAREADLKQQQEILALAQSEWHKKLNTASEALVKAAEELQELEKALKKREDAADERDKQLTARERALIPQERFQSVVDADTRQSRALPDISNIHM